MIDGHKLYQMSRVESVPGGGRFIILEVIHENVKFKQYLPKGITDNGYIRDRDIIQFYTNPGGLRTVAAEDIVDTDYKG